MPSRTAWRSEGTWSATWRKSVTVWFQRQEGMAAGLAPRAAVIGDFDMQFFGRGQGHGLRDSPSGERRSATSQTG
jgi:hypothetical protein